MRLIIQEDRKRVQLFAALYIAKRINDFAPTSSKPFVVAMPCGRSVVGAYAHLARLYKEGKVSFENVVMFCIDEYVGLDRNDELSQHTYMVSTDTMAAALYSLVCQRASQPNDDLI